MRNSQSIKDKLKIICKQKHVSFNILFREYIYERFIERLSFSHYQLNFIIKGGYYLSKVLGIENRSTMDIDACLKNSDLSKENLNKIVEEIINIDLKDGVIFEIIDIYNIRDEDEYGGYRIDLMAKIDNVKEMFHFDIATGDPITSGEIVYNYKSIFSGRTYKILTYNLETILSEKLETIFSRGELNSRMKDYFDVYLIMTLKYDNINFEYLENAIENTFEKRNFDFNVYKIFDIIKESSILTSKWNSYAIKKNIKNISFNDTLNCIENLIKYINVKTC